MKLIQCDQCKQTLPSDDPYYGNPPKTWITIKENFNEKHLCSSECIVNYVNARVIEPVKA